VLLKGKIKERNFAHSTLFLLKLPGRRGLGEGRFFRRKKKAGIGGGGEGADPFEIEKREGAKYWRGGWGLSFTVDKKWIYKERRKMSVIIG